MDHESSGCSEYRRFSRRKFLGYSAATTAAALGPGWLPKIAFASSMSSTRDVIISIYLRGGCDGLTLCVPHGEANYYTSRPTLAVPRPDSGQSNRATDLDGFFGLAPAFKPLHPAYVAGDLAFIHATGSDDPTRSHFDAMLFMESGKPQDITITSGWLGRHLATVPPSDIDAQLRAIAISYGLPRTVQGSPKSLPIPNLDDFGLYGDPNTKTKRESTFRDLYSRVTDPIKTNAINALNSITMLDAIDFKNYQAGGGAVYPTDEFGMAIKSTAALLRAQVGVEAVHIDVGGWDTHSTQGSNGGYLHQLMSSLALGLEAFHKDIIVSSGVNVTVVIVSEFGRNLPENSSKGTDHGHGNCMMVMGQAVNGGQVIRIWPGLNQENLYDGQDLKVTIDYRDILSEIVSKRLENGVNLDVVFPGYLPTFRNVVQA